MRARQVPESGAPAAKLPALREQNLQRAGMNASAGHERRLLV